MTSTPTILDVMDEITTVQRGLVAVVGDKTHTVAQAFPFFQDTGQTGHAGGTPFWRNEWTFLPQERDIDLTVERYVVRMQLVVAHANLAQAAVIATAFMQPTIDAFDQQDEEGHGGVSLGGLVDHQSLRGGNPTLVRFEQPERTFMGLELYLDFQISRGKELS